VLLDLRSRPRTFKFEHYYDEIDAAEDGSAIFSTTGGNSMTDELPLSVSEPRRATRKKSQDDHHLGRERRERQSHSRNRGRESKNAN